MEYLGDINQGELNGRVLSLARDAYNDSKITAGEFRAAVVRGLEVSLSTKLLLQEPKIGHEGSCACSTNTAGLYQKAREDLVSGKSVWLNGVLIPQL